MRYTTATKHRASTRSQPSLSSALLRPELPSGVVNLASCFCGCSSLSSAVQCIHDRSVQNVIARLRGEYVRRKRHVFRHWAYSACFEIPSSRNGRRDLCGRVQVRQLDVDIGLRLYKGPGGSLRNIDPRSLRHMVRRIQRWAGMHVPQP